MTKMADTKTFLALATEADKLGYSRRVKTSTLKQKIDPDGTHVVEVHMLHGDSGNVRSTWLVKLTGQSEPARLELDVNVARFNRLPDYQEAGT